METKIMKLHKDAKIPQQAVIGDVGIDLSTIDSGWILPFQRKLFRTGLAFHPENGYELQIRPRSGMAKNRGLTVLNAPATIEPTYRGDVGVILYNTSILPRKINVGDRIAQGVFKPYEEHVAVKEVSNLGKTERGAKGFGHSGV